MASQAPNSGTPGVKPEDIRGLISQTELEEVGQVYTNFYKYKTYRSGLLKHFRNYNFEQMLIASRELFWNSMTTDSKDLQNLGIDFSIPFARKETMDFLGRMTSLNIKPRMVMDSSDALGMKVINGLYTKWRFKSNDKVEKFWELLYGLVNGTVCSYIGYNNTKLQRRYLRSYDYNTGQFEIETKDQTYWNDVWKEIVPIEDIYLPKIYERNIQKQGRLIWKSQMDESDFHAMYDRKYPNAKYVVSGSRIAEDSLYYRLLGGSGTTSYNKVEILREYDWENDTFKMVASGILLNHLGTNQKPTISPMPFDHKMGPFTWGIMSPLDEKLSYGVPTPFLVKDPNKILNVSYTMMIERELRAIDPPIISSDIESPELIFGQHRVINVNDINAYKEFKISEPSNQYFNMLNSLQSNMTSQAQGGDAAVVPSRQPKSAREVMNNSAQEQQSMANAVTMYYDIIRQEVLLVLKTMFQFYSTEKYSNADKRVFRELSVPDMPLSLGGTGDLHLRIVQERVDDIHLFLENIKKQALNGKASEIIEIPVDILQNFDFQIQKIELEPDSSDDVELANFVENVINPMVNIYVPAGVASLEKTFLRHMEKMKESPADFAADNKGGQQPGGATMQGQVNGQSPTQTPSMLGQGATGGNMKQSVTGIKFGGQNNKGLPIKK